MNLPAENPFAPPPQKKVYKVPRKFDLALIFVVTFSYAAAFGLMQLIHLPPIVQMVLMLALTVVGLIQMFVPERKVRLASVFTGMAGLAVIMVVLAVNSPRGASSYGLFTGFVCGVLGYGSLMGYVAGVLVGSIFMFSDYVRRAFEKLKR